MPMLYALGGWRFSDRAAPSRTYATLPRRPISQESVTIRSSLRTARRQGSCSCLIADRALTRVLCRPIEKEDPLMQRTIVGLAAIALGLGLAAGSAHAQFNTPFKGKQFKGNLMTAYTACTAPDTTTDDAVPACTAFVRSDSNCGYGGGQGKIQLK